MLPLLFFSQKIYPSKLTVTDLRSKYGTEFVYYCTRLDGPYDNSDLRQMSILNLAGLQNYSKNT